MSTNQADKDQKKTTGARESIFRHGLGRTLFLWFLAVSFIPLTFVSVISYWNAHESLKKDAASSLSAVSKVKTEYINAFFSRVLTDVIRQSEKQQNVEFLEELIGAFEKSGKPVGDFVKSFEWAMMVGEQAEDLRNYYKAYGYYGAFLLDKQGNILFTVQYEDDLGTNLFNDKYSNSRFADACKKTVRQAGRWKPPIDACWPPWEEPITLHAPVPASKTRFWFRWKT